MPVVSGKLRRSCGLPRWLAVIEKSPAAGKSEFPPEKKWIVTACMGIVVYHHVSVNVLKALLSCHEALV